jgi:SAM-dependent methyltransferase
MSYPVHMDSTNWDDRYASKELVWGTGPNAFLPPLVQGIRPGTALDVACGEGRNSLWLAEQGWDVTGIDFSPVAIEKAWLLAQDAPITYEVADVESYEPPQPFDLVIVFYVHLIEEDARSMLDMAAKAVAPGGTLFGVGHALRNLTDGVGGPPYPEILWTEELIRPSLDGFDIVELGERKRPIDGSTVDAIDLVVRATRRT